MNYFKWENHFIIKCKIETWIGYVKIPLWYEVIESIFDNDNFVWHLVDNFTILFTMLFIVTCD